MFNLTFSWSTDILATTQVIVTNVATGEQIVTQADNALRTDHSVLVSGLLGGTDYTAQAVSISSDLGKTLSAPISFSTK